MLKAQTPRTIVWWLSIVAALVGLVVSYKLAIDKVKLDFNTQLAASTAAAGSPAETKPATDEESDEAGFLDELCDIGPQADCDAVTASEYSTIRFGDHFAISSAEAGTFFFMCILCWLLIVGQANVPGSWAHAVYLLGTLAGLAGSIRFEIIMWTKLDNWCPLCVLTHIATLLLFIFAVLLWPRRASRSVCAMEEDSAGEQPAAGMHAWPTPRTVIATVIMAAIACLAVHSQFMLISYQQGMKVLSDNRPIVDTSSDASPDTEVDKLQKTVDYYRKERDTLRKQFEHYQHTLLGFAIEPQVWIDTANRPSIGPDDAKHTVTIFSDFQCSACKKYEGWFRKLVVKRAQEHGDVRIVFLHWPICTDCNPTSKTNLHPKACKAAYAAEAAFILGGNDAFWKMHDLLFEHQSEWMTADELPFIDFAEQLGIDRAAFEETMNGEEVQRIVKSHIQQGTDLGMLENIPEEKREYLKVKSTPSVYFDNKRLFNPGQTKVWTTLWTSRTVPLTTKPEPTLPVQPASPDEPQP